MNQMFETDPESLCPFGFSLSLQLVPVPFSALLAAP
jgi:hypothetical protein